MYPDCYPCRLVDNADRYMWFYTYLMYTCLLNFMRVTHDKMDHSVIGLNILRNGKYIVVFNRFFSKSLFLNTKFIRRSVRDTPSPYKYIVPSSFTSGYFGTMRRFSIEIQYGYIMRKYERILCVNLYQFFVKMNLLRWS